MNEFAGTRLASDFKLCIVHVNGDDTSTVKCGCGDCAEAYAATAKDRDGLVFGNAPASRGVETDRRPGSDT